MNTSILFNNIIVRNFNYNRTIPTSIKEHCNIGDNVSDFDLINLYKWWGLRDDIIDYLLTVSIDELSDNYNEIVLDKADLVNIRNIFIKFLDYNYFVEKQCCELSDYEDVIEDIGSFIGRLSWLIKIYDEHPEMNVYFIDAIGD